MKKYTAKSIRSFIFVGVTVILLVAAITADAIAETAVTAIIDDFNDADPSDNFLGMETSAGIPDGLGGDLVSSYDIYGPNPFSLLNTSHQLSWDKLGGATQEPEDAFWYSFINEGAGLGIPVADFSHLIAKFMTTRNTPVDVIGIDLQVNYPPGNLDIENKPFRIYRAYQPLVEWLTMDYVVIDYKDFMDEFDTGISFVDNLAYNLQNLRAVAVAMLDPTDDYLMDNDGDGVDLNLDNKGTIFLEDVTFWNKAESLQATLMIDDFEDAFEETNLLGMSTGGIGDIVDYDETHMGSGRHRIEWNGPEQRWFSDVSNGGTQPLDVSGYTHLAFDIIGAAEDMGDIYIGAVFMDPPGPTTPREYWYRKGVNAKRIDEVYIPFNELEDEYNNPIDPASLTVVEEIRLLFNHTEQHRAVIPPLGDNSQGTVWIDNVRFVNLGFDTLYNYPPLISSIDGQDVTNDFEEPFAQRRSYEKVVTVGDEAVFDVVAGDYLGNISSLSAQALTSMSSFVFDANITGDSATGTFTWTPEIADIGSHIVEFTVIDDKGAKDIQGFTLTVADPDDPPYVSIVSPQNGATVSPAGFPFYGFAIDSYGVTDVRVYVLDTGWVGKHGGRGRLSVYNRKAIYIPAYGIWGFNVLPEHVTPGSQAWLVVKARDVDGNWSPFQYIRVDVSE